MAARNKDTSTFNRSTRSRTARGDAVARGNTTTVGGSPAAAEGTSPEQESTQERLQAQRDVAAEKAPAARTQAAAASAPALAADTSTIFTAVVRNGLSHRRNGVIFGAEPTTVDVNDWTPEQKQRFFSDGLMMIVPGQNLGGRAILGMPVSIARTAAPAQSAGVRDLAAALNERPEK